MEMRKVYQNANTLIVTLPREMALQARIRRGTMVVFELDGQHRLCLSPLSGASIERLNAETKAEVIDEQ